MGLKLGLVPAAPSGFQWWKACKNHNGGCWQSPYLTLPVCMHACIYIYINAWTYRVPPNLMFIIMFPFKTAIWWVSHMFWTHSDSIWLVTYPMKSEKNIVFFLDKLLLFDGYGESRESHHITTKTFAAQHRSFKALLNAAVSAVDPWPCAVEWLGDGLCWASYSTWVQWDIMNRGCVRMHIWMS